MFDDLWLASRTWEGQHQDLPLLVPTTVRIADPGVGHFGANRLRDRRARGAVGDRHLGPVPRPDDSDHLELLDVEAHELRLSHELSERLPAAVRGGVIVVQAEKVLLLAEAPELAHPGLERFR